MSTKAAAQFRKRSKEYIENEDGLNFNGRYHGDDIKRLLWSKFHALTKEVTKDTIQPYVFFDGIEKLTLEGMLSPLITKLKTSNKKYYPFIFKPEIGSVHYVAGFLRKNEDSSVSIILFNPTGTSLRVKYGNYAYEAHLMDTDADDSDEELENIIYMRVHKGALQYTVINPEGDESTNELTPDNLKRLGINIDLTKPLTKDALKTQIKPKLAQILEITCSRNETEKKIQIISSPHKVQTPEKDGGPLVSCGPLCVEFIDYILNHPEYMSSLDEQFNLPESLASLIKDDVPTYQDKITTIRRQHNELLETISDDSLDSIDKTYDDVNELILSEHNKKTEYIDYDDMLEAADNDSQIYDSLDEELYQEAAIETPVNHDQTPIVSTVKQLNDDELEPVIISSRADVMFIKSEIQRFKDNAKSFFSINNTMKAEKIEKALQEALSNHVEDVRNDEGVKEALAIHRIFGFFGCKQTTATSNNEDSLVKSYLSKG